MKFLDSLSLGLGRIFGIPVIIHWSMWPVLLYLASLNLIYLPIMLFVYLIVLLHEFGHCFAAASYGIRTYNIFIYPIGGTANIDYDGFKVPKQELFIIACGPLVNIVLIIVLFPLIYFDSLYGTVSHYVYQANLIFIAFNLLPIFPMDGGRIVRACLSCMTGKPLLSTKIAVRIGQVLAIPIGILAFVYSYYFAAAAFAFVVYNGELELRGLKKDYAPSDEASEIMRQMSHRMARLSRFDRNH